MLQAARRRHPESMASSTARVGPSSYARSSQRHLHSPRPPPTHPPPFRTVRRGPAGQQGHSTGVVRRRSRRPRRSRTGEGHGGTAGGSPSLSVHEAEHELLEKRLEDWRAAGSLNERFVSSARPQSVARAADYDELPPELPRELAKRVYTLLWPRMDGEGPGSLLAGWDRRSVPRRTRTGSWLDLAHPCFPRARLVAFTPELVLLLPPQALALTADHLWVVPLCPVETLACAPPSVYAAWRRLVRHLSGSSSASQSGPGPSSVSGGSAVWIESALPLHVRPYAGARAHALLQAVPVAASQLSGLRQAFRRRLSLHHDLGEDVRALRADPDPDRGPGFVPPGSHYLRILFGLGGGFLCLVTRPRTWPDALSLEILGASLRQAAPSSETRRAVAVLDPLVVQRADWWQVRVKAQPDPQAVRHRVQAFLERMGPRLHTFLKAERARHGGTPADQAESKVGA